MSVSVDTVYQRVLGILNKEQRGYVTPQEFNLFANQAQLDLFEQYFYDINQFGRSTRNSTEYSDMVDLLNKKIAIFEDQATLTYDSVNNYYTLPSDLYRLGTIIYTNSTTKDFYPSPTQIANYPVSNPTVYRKIINESIEAQRVNGNELLYINLSPLTKPKNTLPIYTSKNNKINVYGNEELITGVKCNYIRKPAKVEWKYQMVYGEALYDSTYSQDFELEPSEETELVIKVLELAGLSTRDIQMYQVAAGEEIKNTQQEKA